MGTVEKTTSLTKNIFSPEFNRMDGQKTILQQTPNPFTIRTVFILLTTKFIYLLIHLKIFNQDT